MQALIAVLVLLVASCGRRNFNEDDAGVAVIDARPCEAPPAADCLDPVVYTCDGLCFIHCENLATRPSAASICEQWGGCLPTIQTQTRNNCAARNVSDAAWIGALQLPTAVAPADGWVWCDDSQLTYTRWNVGEPADGDGSEDGQQQCASVTSGGDWFDTECSDRRTFVCARPM